MAQFKDRTIDSFKSALKYGGARSNLFEVGFGRESGSGPNSILPDNITQGLTFDSSDLMLIKAAAIPASTIPEIPVPFRGRTLKIAGDRTFDIWTITVINDADFKWRNLFERWMNYISKVSDGSGSIELSTYMFDMNVVQLSRGPTGPLNTKGSNNTDEIEELRRYVIHGAFPTNISSIELSYNNENEIEEFTVDLQMQWWEAYGGTIQTETQSGVSFENDSNNIV
jgi:hypothetical protein